MAIESLPDVHTGPEAEAWYRRARRWTQLTFVEDDPLHFDREFWAEVMRRTASNAACISAGGYIAYYPTQVAHHHRSRHLGDLDLFGMVNEDARRLGMTVMARIDPHAIHGDAARAHPEWLARDEHGEPIEHWAFPGIWLTCPYSTYYSEFVPEITREIVREYGVDAVFANRWESSTQISYSERARRLYRSATGAELPTGEDRTTSEWGRYFAWRSEHLSRQIVDWDRTLREVNPRGNFIPNRGGMLTRDLDAEIIKGMYPAFFIDKQGRGLGEAIWSAGRTAKRARAMHPERPITLITSVGPEIRAFRWKDSVAAGPEVQAWIVEGFVHGALPWFTKFNAYVGDPRWVDPVADAFTLHERAEHLYGDKRAVARVAILDPWKVGGTATPLAGYHHEDAAEDGVYQALVEARIPFEYLVGDTLTPQRLREFRVVVVPGSADLAEEHVAMLRDYVADGGALVADSGAVLGAAGLADLVGVSVTGPLRRDVRNNYIAVTDPGHEIVRPFGPAERIVGGTAVLPVAAAEGTVVPFRFVPDYPDVPMEEVYPREGPRDPAVVLREHPGGGRTAYAAFDLPALFWTALQADHADLLAGLVRWALAGDEPVTVTGEGLVDIGVRESATGVAVSLVDLDDPKALRGQLRTRGSLAPQTVAVRAPAGATAATVRTLGAPDPVEVPVVDGRVTATASGGGLLDVVEIAWR